MSKNKSNTPIISFIGKNSEQVTGSIILVTTNKGTQILLECGSVQGGNVEEDYRDNSNSLNSVNLDNVKYLFINHPHYDHCASAPRAVKLGLKAKIIASHKTAKIMYPLLKDSAFINVKNAVYLTDKHKMEIPPLYEESDVEEMFDSVYEYDTDVIHELDDEISFRLLENNHVLGATSLELFIRDTESNKTYKIFYSSDLGNVSIPNRPYLSELEYCKTANVSIFESTYGDKEEFLTKKDRKKEIALMKKEITNTCIRNNHTVIIPCFSFARSQEIMTILYKMFKDDKQFRDIEFIVDSRLTKEIIKVYQEVLEGKDKELFEKVLAWKNFNIISDFKKETSLVLKSTNPKVIISSSGMISAGHVIEYVKNYIEDKLNTIIFVGYAGENTLAGKLRTDVNTVKIDKDFYKKEIGIITLLTFSSHMQKRDLVNYISSINCDKVILVHGDKSAKESLKESCREELNKRNKTTNIIVSQRGMKISL